MMKMKEHASLRVSMTLVWSRNLPICNDNLTAIAMILGLEQVGILQSEIQEAIKQQGPLDFKCWAAAILLTIQD